MLAQQMTKQRLSNTRSPPATGDVLMNSKSFLKQALIDLAGFFIKHMIPNTA